LGLAHFSVAKLLYTLHNEPIIEIGTFSKLRGFLLTTQSAANALS